MKLLDSIRSRGNRGGCVELYQGDLTDVSARDAFDLLVVSAFPDNYVPTYGSLIGALDAKGLSVWRLAHAKELDLRAAFSCWLSSALSPREGLPFRRILCFEPLVRGHPAEVVGDIFRALAPILAEHADLRTIALPLVAAGDQGYPAAEILSPLLDAALHWLDQGLPLDRIKIVAYSQRSADEAAAIFAQHKARYQQTGTVRAAARADYDVFISYSRANAPETRVMEQALRQQMPEIRIFLDRNELDVGCAWQPAIFESLDRCSKVVAMLSPDYLASKVCKEEFNIAWIRSRETDQDIIFPVYLYTAELPTYMRYRSYVDCREGSQTRLAEASRHLVAALGAAGPGPPVSRVPR
ncbi:MAG TPA: TIR domain-containing protein [Kofleriaceae bacterium]|jgi:hypothetical protein|nr:TIR domain-containing protein [Kofleriaceae bacterium]